MQAPSLTLNLEEIRFSEMSANFCQTTRRHNPEDSTLHSHHLLLSTAIQHCQSTLKLTRKNIKIFWACSTTGSKNIHQTVIKKDL
jgi:hypothetical protein